MKRLLLFVLISTAVFAQSDATMNSQVEPIMKQFQDKKYDDVIAAVDKMDVSGDAKAFLLNLQGAAYTKKKEYNKARAAFKGALDIAPGMFAAKFNYGEVDFLQKNYQQAADWFRSMLVNDPKNELLQFKVFLSHLEADDKEGAQKALSKMRYPGDTPAWYFSQAAWEFESGNKAKARDYVTGARYIFPGKTAIFEETFTDLGIPIK